MLSIRDFHKKFSERQGSNMSDFELISLIIAIINLVVMILLKYIDHIKK